MRTLLVIFLITSLVLTGCFFHREKKWVDPTNGVSPGATAVPDSCKKLPEIPNPNSLLWNIQGPELPPPPLDIVLPRLQGGKPSPTETTPKNNRNPPPSKESRKESKAPVVRENPRSEEFELQYHPEAFEIPCFSLIPPETISDVPGNLIPLASQVQDPISVGPPLVSWINIQSQEGQTAIGIGMILFASFVTLKMMTRR